MKEIEEGKLSDAAARILALAVKKKVINKGREVRSTQDPDKKWILLSQQVSALAALTLVGISVGGDGLLSKGGILSGLFTEDFQKEIESKLTTTPPPLNLDPEIQSIGIRRNLRTISLPSWISVRRTLILRDINSYWSV